VHSRALARHGYQVDTALDGGAALRALRALRALAERPFDVVLSDLEMPGMNGMTLLEQVRAHDLEVPVVVITGKLVRGSGRYVTPRSGPGRVPVFGPTPAAIPTSVSA
jgi:CheY-like chemotaxis protein